VTAAVEAVRPDSSTRSRFHTLRVARVDRLCEDAAAVTFDVPVELTDTFRFRPGQWLTVERNGQRRSYSISSPAGAAPRIGVREVPGGAVSSWLVREVRPGDEVRVQAPSGTFTPDLSVSARHALIAAGSGITPVLSIAASVLADGVSEVVLVYGNRRTSTVMFADDIADLKDRYPTRLQVVHVMSREAQEVELFTGRLDRAKLRELLPLTCDVAAVDHWWVCGPFGMIMDVTGVLQELSVPVGRIHRELFYVEDVAPPPALHRDGPVTGASVTVVLDGRATTTTIPAEVPILDGAQRVRPDLPFACKGGVCGTCRAKVTAGEVHLRRNFALEPAELDAGFVLTCQALPVSDEVSVDYDA
jgi:ring-1,2-phenylacetyl-CoA epoxidase subunit PaaE